VTSPGHSSVRRGGVYNVFINHETFKVSQTPPLLSKEGPGEVLQAFENLIGLNQYICGN
jgi:hypothetical protein